MGPLSDIPSHVVLHHLLPFLEVRDVQSMVAASKDIARSLSLTLPLDDLSFRSYACGGSFACEQHLLQDGRVGAARSRGAACCPGREGDPEAPTLCGACYEGRREHHVECQNCDVFFCDRCIQGPFHEGEGCWRCPDHGIGCTDYSFCDVCEEHKCRASHKFYFCEYCNTEMCRDCLKDLNLRIAECTDPACREERNVYIHCFPLCAGGNAGVANPCTGGAAPPGPFENLNAGDIHALMEVGIALGVFGAGAGAGAD